MPGDPVRTIAVESVPLAVIKRQVQRAELARVVPECCGLVWNAVRTQGARGGRHVALYWDEDIHLEVGVELLGPFADRENVVRSATPAGTVATATLLGPYAGLGAAHTTVRRWCRENGHRLAGPNWEIYGHWDEAWNTEPSRIRTDIFYLLTEEH